MRILKNKQQKKLKLLFKEKMKKLDVIQLHIYNRFGKREG